MLWSGLVEHANGSMTAIPLGLLAEITELALTPWRGFGLRQPTPASIERISAALELQVPDELVTLAAAAPSYGGWFGGLGDDFDHPQHILTLNRDIHDSEQEEGDAPLPAHLILLNHGQDGDCDCWDTRSTGPAGEHPIVYYDFAMRQPSQDAHDSFLSYLEAFCRAFGPAVTDPARSARIREILDAHPD